MPYFDPTVLPGVGTSARVAEDYLVTLKPEAVFIYGDVLDNGGNINLSKNGNFQRIGTHVEASATADAGVLNGVGLNASYDYQRSYGGPVVDINLLTVALKATPCPSRIFGA